MDIRTPVKRVLRMCGHALVSTIHERLNVVDQALRDLAYQNTHIAETQTALLQSGVYLVESMALVHAKMQQIEERVETQAGTLATQADLQSLLAVIDQLRLCTAGKAELQALDRQVAVLREDIPQVAERLGAQVRNLLNQAVQSLDQRLNVLQDLLEANAHLAETQTALLQSGLHLVETTKVVRAEIEQLKHRLTAQMCSLASQTDVQNLLAALGELRTASAGKTEWQSLEHQVGILHGTLEQHTQLQKQIPQLDQRLRDLLNATLEAFQSVNDQLEKVREVGKVSVQSGVERILSLGENVRNTAVQSLARLETTAREMQRFLADESVRQVAVETSDYLSTNQELGLFAFLYSFLPSRIVLDIGANTGDVAAHLLKTGYEVYAFEPHPTTYRLLQERLGSQPEFHALNCALGTITGEVPLYTVKDSSPDKQYENPSAFCSLAKHGMPEDLPFAGSVRVAIQKLSELHKNGVVPADASLVKIDTEGYDLEVIRGMDDYRYPVVTVEFWDINIPFGAQGLLYTVESMVAEMRQRGYLWYIVIYRVWGQNRTAFYCNHDQSVPGSWGNILFFRERETFVQAQQWCSAVLPRTYFKHVIAAAAAPQDLHQGGDGAYSEVKATDRGPF